MSVLLNPMGLVLSLSCTANGAQPTIVCIWRLYMSAYCSWLTVLGSWVMVDLKRSALGAEQLWTGWEDFWLLRWFPPAPFPPLVSQLWQSSRWWVNMLTAFLKAAKVDQKLNITLFIGQSNYKSINGCFDHHRKAKRLRNLHASRCTLVHAGHGSTLFFPVFFLAPCTVIKDRLMLLIKIELVPKQVLHGREHACRFAASVNFYNG